MTTFDVTVGKVLSSEEAVLVQFAADKRLGITVLREHLQTVPSQTLLKNAVRSEPLAIEQISVFAYREYGRWLNSLVRHFSFGSISTLCDAISGRRSQTKLKNVKGARVVPHDVPPSYGFGLDANKGRDVWGEITVGATQKVVKFLDVIRREASERVRYRLESPSRPPLGDVALAKYVGTRLSQAEGVLADIIQPGVFIVGLTMSTDPKRIKLVSQMWQGRSWLMDVTQSFESEEPSWRDVLTNLINQAKHCERSGIPMLLVMDCALGWPSDMAAAIGSHDAGGGLPAPASDRRRQAAINWRDLRSRANQAERSLNFGGSETNEETRWRTERNLFFRRVTEMHVREYIRNSYSRPYGPNGLDVGADKSARTTHQALRVLDEVRRGAQLNLPVVTTWCGPIIESSVIEVTTAAAKRRPSTDVTPGRDPAEDSDVRDEDLRQTSGQTTPGELMLRHGAEFLNGKLATPRHCGVSDDLARKEGWIWSIPASFDPSYTEM